MGLEVIPARTRERYHIEERRHACAILSTDCSSELQDIVNCLDQFELLRSEIVAGGGGKTKIAKRFDDFLAARGWAEKSVKVGRKIDETVTESETHKVDFFKGRVAVEVEWNNKDPFFSRDLDVFRLLHELDVISAGVIITRMDELQEIFDALPDVWDEKWKRWTNIGSKYGPSTTHWAKLIPPVERGAAGTCPLLLVGITKRCYRDDLTKQERVEAAAAGIKSLGVSRRGVEKLVGKSKLRGG
jgi:hypothetical protein